MSNRDHFIETYPCSGNNLNADVDKTISAVTNMSSERGSAAAAHTLIESVINERQFLANNHSGDTIQTRREFDQYLHGVEIKLQQSGILPELTVYLDPESSRTAPRTNAETTKQERSLAALNNLPKSATLESGKVLYDLASDSLAERAKLTGEPVNSDSILRECNRIMVENGYPDAHLDGKSHITMQDLPAAWNGVRYGQNFKLYSDQELAKYAKMVQGTSPGDSTSPGGTLPPAEITQSGNTLPPVEIPPPVKAEIPPPVEKLPPTDSTQAVDLSNPNSFFMTQFPSKWNPDGPPGLSENCGPASLAMAFKAFHMSPDGSNPDDHEKLIDATRIAMTGSNDVHKGTGYDQVLNGARKGHLHADMVSGVDGIDSALDEGRMVVAGGNPAKAYGGRLSNGEYSHYDGGHFILVVGRQGENYIINDPLSRVGSMIISRKEMIAYLGGLGNAGVSVGP